MNHTTREQSISDSSGAHSLIGPGAVSSNLVTSVLNWFEKYLLVLVIGGLIAGIGVAGVSQTLVDQVNAGGQRVHGRVRPDRANRDFSDPHAVSGSATVEPKDREIRAPCHQLALRKILASLWAIVFVLIVFRIPILPQGSLSLTDGISETVGSLGKMMLTGTYFWAMYAAIAVSVLSTRAKTVTRALERVMDFVETAGSYLLPLMPIFMFAIGAYIYGLPDNVQQQIALDADGKGVLVDLDIWGWTTSPQSSSGMITIYVLALIHRRTACRRPAEETKGCASESGIMVLKQKTGPRKGAPDRCYHVTTPTASKSPSTTTAWWPMPG